MNKAQRDVLKWAGFTLGGCCLFAFLSDHTALWFLLSFVGFTAGFYFRAAENVDKAGF